MYFVVHVKVKKFLVLFDYFILKCMCSSGIGDKNLNYVVTELFGRFWCNFFCTIAGKIG